MVGEEDFTHEDTGLACEIREFMEREHQGMIQFDERLREIPDEAAHRPAQWVASRLESQ
jgi:hypothetical protein